MDIDMRTLVWLVRALLLMVLSLPLVIGGVVLAMRAKRASAGPDPASIGTAPRPAVVSRIDCEPARREAFGANDSHASGLRVERRAA